MPFSSMMTGSYHENYFDGTLCQKNVRNLKHVLTNYKMSSSDVENIVKLLISYKRIDDFKDELTAKVGHDCPIWIPLLEKLGYDTKFQHDDL